MTQRKPSKGCGSCFKSYKSSIRGKSVRERLFLVYSCLQRERRKTTDTDKPTQIDTQKALHRKGRDNKLYTTKFTYSAQKKKYNLQNTRVTQRDEKKTR